MKLLNWMLHAFHIGLIAFTLFGWLIPPLRPWHLLVCGLTLLSWFAIGLPAGKPGFCVITELHYRIRRRLGIQGERESYIFYLVRSVLGRSPDKTRLEIATQGIFYTVTLLSIFLTVRG